MKTRQMVDKSFSQHMIYQVFKLSPMISSMIRRGFYVQMFMRGCVFEVFCIVDKMMFSHTDTESRLGLCGRNRAI